MLDHGHGRVSQVNPFLPTFFLLLLFLSWCCIIAIVTLTETETGPGVVEYCYDGADGDKFSILFLGGLWKSFDTLFKRRH